MAHDLISVNWTAQPLSGEQLLVLRNVAVLYLKRGNSESEVHFTHELIEGILIHKSQGMFVTFAGNFFHANLGLVKGERWSVDFLLPRGSERLQINEKSIVLSGRHLATGIIEHLKLDPSLARTSEHSLLD